MYVLLPDKVFLVIQTVGILVQSSQRISKDTLKHI